MSVKGLKALQRLCEKWEKKEKVEEKERGVVYPCIRVKGNRGKAEVENVCTRTGIRWW